MFAIRWEANQHGFAGAGRDDIAYILHLGTTGTPKGCDPAPQRDAVVADLDPIWTWRAGVVAVSFAAFDFSVWEIWGRCLRRAAGGGARCGGALAGGFARDVGAEQSLC